MDSRQTAMDIEKQEFKRKVRGYDPDDVRLYLKSVAEEVERLHLENGRIREEAGLLRAEIEGLRSREKTLQQTLVSAQGMAEEMKQRARADYELQIKQARLDAEQLLRAAQDELTQIETDILRSRLERETFETRLRSVIDQHLTMLDLRRQARGELDNLRVLTRHSGADAG